MNGTIRRAETSEAAALTAIAHEAKRHWGYPEEWIELWKPALTVTPEFIARHEVFVTQVEGEVAGFYALIQNADGRWDLDHLWIRPRWMGLGLGRKLFGHAAGRLAEIASGAVFGIEADPNAESFYLRMGARRTGQIARNWQGVERVLPYLEYTHEERGNW